MWHYVCTLCAKGAYLETSSGKCLCRPGHTGKKCKKCSKKQVSPGGAVPAPKCDKCPKYTAANLDGSACIADPKRPAKVKATTGNSWTHWGGDLHNRRWAQAETLLSPANAGSLSKKWTATITGSTSATPTVVGGFIYIPDWKGKLYCLDAATGSVVWQTTVHDYIAEAGGTLPSAIELASLPILSRTSPVVFEDLLIFGTLRQVFGGFGYYIAVEKATGKFRWGVEVDRHPAAIITQSPTIYNGVLYGGISSLEESLSSRADYKCCSFLGSAVALDARTGALKWRTMTSPDVTEMGADGNRTQGWAGAGIWGSSPVIDRARGQVVMATSNNYEMPDEVEDCLKALGPLSVANAAEQAVCMKKGRGSENFHNSFVAFDLETGRIKWGTPVDGPDAWNAACISQDPSIREQNCPDNVGPDFAFGQAPMLVTPCKEGKGCRQLYVGGQKSGILWAMDPSDGKIVWSTRAGPGGILGGLQWGSASDDQTVYVNNNNAYHLAVDLLKDGYYKPVANVLGSSTPPASTTGGMCIAVDAWDGSIKWTFANPATRQLGNRTVNAGSLNPVTVANGVVFYASMDLANGWLHALNSADGRLLGRYDMGASAAGGPAVVDGVVYIGSGYPIFGQGSEGTKIHALQAPPPPPKRG
ncbi:MAG: pyrrolo-quinoline quinone repeat-containing protein [Monoraphidium minutum]|nr:MAG: pyrrolo-quinoline quinone repeat-containing protein [Monoraphidium minutum]